MDNRAKVSKSNLGEYTKPKWKSGKTTAIRIPEKIKDEVLEFARKLDEGVEEKDNSIAEVVEYLKMAILSKAEGGNFDGRKGGELRRKVVKAIAQLEEYKKSH